MPILAIVQGLDEKPFLIDALPDLVILLRRDGVVLSHIGGRAVAALIPPGDAVGRRLESVWPEPAAALVKQLVRSAIARRTTVEAPLKLADLEYAARVSAQGPDRAICVIRAAMAQDPDEAAGAAADPQLDRRGFVRRLQATLSQALIGEKPISVAVIHLDGVAEIARIVDAKVSEQVLHAAILRLPQESLRAAATESWVYLGQLHENVLALVMETSDRDTIEACVSQICASLREPISVGDAAFHLTPFAGVAVLGEDATSSKNLLEHAHAAATEALRSGAPHVRFFSDTLKLRSLARLDIARELREAIFNRDIRLRYLGRHDLATGRLVACVGYFRWTHPLRGEVHPADFLGVAETTGLATLLSRAVLKGLREDFTALAAHVDADVRISFGALRHHLLHDDFVSDIERFLAEGVVPASRLELRIAERTFIVMDASVCRSLRDLGVQLVVDEIGRGMGSFDRLARSPVWGMQLDRAWVTALRHDAVALKVCRAGIGAAAALGLTPIATGVDDEEQRQALLALGCRHGSGDLYREAAPDISRWSRIAVI